MSEVVCVFTINKYLLLPSILFTWNSIRAIGELFSLQL